MTPRQARAARAMLGLSIQAVCDEAEVGKRTLTEFEGGTRTLNRLTELKILQFYIARGIGFSVNGSVTESVLYHHKSDVEIEPIRDKVEYRDVFEIDAVIENVKLIINQLQSEQKSINISKKLMLVAKEASGSSQKYLASQMGFTPQFMSAILAGLKQIPAFNSVKIHKLLNISEEEVVDLLRLEKAIKKSNGAAIKGLEMYLDLLEQCSRRSF